MSEHPPTESQLLSAKIARLVRERGWNQEDFANFTRLNRQTVHSILHEGTRKLRNATVGACATALNLAVNDLLTLPVERLVERMKGRLAADADEALKHLREQASHPELVAWIERNKERAGRLTPSEIDELISLQGTGGLLSGFGVEDFVKKIERKRKLIQQVHAIAGTEYVDLLEQLVGLMYEKVQPHGERI